MRMTNLLVVSALIFSVAPAWAKDLSGLKEKLTEARQKIEAASKAPAPDQAKEPPSFAYSDLFGEAYNALLEESKQLLKVRKGSESYRKRVKEFVEVSALTVYLEPGQVSAEIAFELSRSKKAFQRTAFNEAMQTLEPALKNKLTTALKYEERSRREGNG